MNMLLDASDTQIALGASAAKSARMALLLAQDQAKVPQLSVMWLLGGVLLVVMILCGVYLFSYLLRRMLSGKSSPSDDLSPKPSIDNPTAFMAASMQAVIQKLRDQEKELAALHRQDRERAEQTERLSEAVTRNMPAGLLLVSSAGLITSANPAAEVALGVRALGYRRYTETFGAQTPLVKLLDVCLREGRTFRREEVEYTTPGGEMRRLGVTISPIVNNGGPVVDTGQAVPSQITGALCLLADLTELAALQRQVLMKESLAALGELSAGIAHEFKNSLATISGYAQLIRAESQGDIAENSQRILEQTRALAHVVTEFLKFARPMDLVDEEIAVSPLVDRVIAEVCDVAANVKLSRTGEFENISGDEALLRQALLNLTRNAAEAAGTHAAGRTDGCVTLRGSIEHTSGQSVQRISVSDNGPGIPSADLSRIFVPFYTTKANGTGLGLAIVQKIVVQHGGTVEARNQAGGGAEFIVWLPLSRQASSAVDSVATSI